ncbi:hypothetical protein JZ751_014666 [Albula glossodonta]|uniref:Spen paralogue and orthologue SPOC C-terminal domain-containing protein n=1 Tax=Albula glossodonta TaxID=121402 RepID=A0A8T2N406_9TELE|nr:hypothetical protein JZ751_014666 [Albula glossodonta]
MKNPNLRHPPPMNKPLPISRDVVTKKQNLPSRKSFISKKSIPVAAVTSQAACPPASKSVSGALRVSKINYTVPRMLSPQQQLSLALSSAACFASSSQPPRPQPNNQIRHDIRRSLTEILIKRGEVTPFNLVRFSPEELLSQDVSGWMHKETTEVAVSSKTLPGPLRLGLKQEAPPMEKGESPLMSEGNACLSAASPLSCVASVPEQENRAPTSPLCKPSQHNVASPATDFFSMMLNDTTAEHRTHLFNLNCKICTGRVSTDDEPVSKKPKNALTTEQESHRSKAEDCEGDSPPPDSDFSIMESPASPDDTSNMATISEPIPIPAVPSVTITVRDPRIAGYRPIVTVPPVIPTVSSSAESFSTTKPTLPPPPPPPPPKSILLKPTSSPAMRFLSASGSSSSMADSRAPPGGETTLFLSKQEVVWKGFLNMHSVAKFVTKSYLVSGSLDNLKEELCLIRFQPATDEEEVAYISLFSYFNSRGRFGVVANNSRNIKDLYLIPLGAKAPIPTQFLPFEGPGKNSPSIAASSATPLQTILKTLFGNKKVESGAALSSEHNLVEVKAPPAALLDPIVKQFGHISKEIMMEEDDSKRPYDPEEEYDPGMGYPMEEDDNRPYDPEEEYDPALDYTIKEDDNRPYDPEEEYDPGMGYKIKEDEDNRPYDPEEEYLRTYEIEEDDDRPYDPEEEYSHGMAQKFLARVPPLTGRN